MNDTGTLESKWTALIFTDLDGSLLDHFDYSTAPADKTLIQLEKLGIPVIFSTSKTFDEVLTLREQLNNKHPFIVENGAAIYLPKNYFGERVPPGFSESQDPNYTKASLSEDRAYWLAILDKLKPCYGKEFTHFYEMGIPGIARATGLSKEKAQLANRREYTEPVLWTGSSDRKVQFIQDAHQSGAEIEEGGRFLHMMGQCDKGQALAFLLQQYQQFQNKPIFSLALGDGKNDLPMLYAADAGVLIRSPVHPFPEAPNQDHIIKTDHYGPHGWREGVQKIVKKALPNLITTLE